MFFRISNNFVTNSWGALPQASKMIFPSVDDLSPFSEVDVIKILLPVVFFSKNRQPNFQ